MSVLTSLAALVLACAPSTKPESDPMRSAIATWMPSVNFNARMPRMIIVHHTNMSSFESALEILSNAARDGKVSAHYLIARDGRIAQLVADDQRAWHAGLSEWEGQGDVNSLSIGIELDNDGASAFPAEQIEALLALLKDLTDRMKIAPQNVWAHADIAPVRKNDPSAYFPWERLAEHGFGLWPKNSLAQVRVSDVWQALAQIGYDTTDSQAALRAFRRHFRGPEFLEKQLAALANNHDPQVNFDTNAYTVWPEPADQRDFELLAALLAAKSE